MKGQPRAARGPCRAARSSGSLNMPLLRSAFPAWRCHLGESTRESREATSMGEKGNDVAGAAPSLIERTTTVVSDTTGEIADAIKGQVIGAAAAGAVGAAGQRLRGDDDEEAPDEQPPT
jgi:hypothetical protein